jgi:hypothetical protein
MLHYDMIDIGMLDITASPTLSIVKLSVATITIIGLFATLSINIIGINRVKHNDT